jgi:hypothetical protein
MLDTPDGACIVLFVSYICIPEHLCVFSISNRWKELKLSALYLASSLMIWQSKNRSHASIRSINHTLILWL